MTSRSSQRYLISAMFLVIAIDAMGTGFVWPLFGPLFTGKETTLFTNAVSMEWRNILYGITIGVANLAALLGAPFLGDVSDRIGRRKVLFFCLMGTSLGMMISITGIILNQVLLLIFSRAFLGAVAASQVIAQATIIDTSTLENKSSRLGVISAANNTGYILGPVLGSLLVDSSLVHWFNLTVPFYFASILSFLSALFLLKVFKETKKVFSSAKIHDVKSKFTSKMFIFTRAFTEKPIRKVAIIYFCLQIGWALYLQTNFLLLIQKYEYTSRLLGYFLLWLEAIFCFNLLIMVRIVTKLIKLKTIIYVGLTISAICCFVGGIFNTEIGVWLNILPMAGAIALGSNAILTNLSNTAAEHEQGWAMGIGSSLAALAWTITPPITGVILAFSFSLPLFIASLLFLLGISVFILGFDRI